MPGIYCQVCKKEIDAGSSPVVSAICKQCGDRLGLRDVEIQRYWFIRNLGVDNHAGYVK
ncbi:MAG: hypothetical protein ACOC53_01505 [Candidatus Saliniplasma sp.]